MFLITNFSRQTVAMNAGLDNTTSPPTAAPQIFSFMSTTDNAATVEGANYFAPASYDLFVNDYIFCTCSDVSVLLQVLTVDNTVVPALVTTEVVGFSGSVGTANIIDNAVTYAKFQEVAANSLVGNPTGSLADAEGITLGNGLSFSGTTLQVAPTIGSSAAVTMTASQWNGMYAAPLQIVAAPGANLMLVLDSVVFEENYGSAQYAAGGAAALQYGNTVHGAGVLATGAVAAATVNGIAADSIFSLLPVALGATANASLVNQGLFMSNLTGAFTTGDSPITVTVTYHTIAIPA